LAIAVSILLNNNVIPDRPSETPDYFGPPYRQEFCLENKFLQFDWYDFYISYSPLAHKKGKLADVVEGFVLKEEPVEIEYEYEYTIGNFFDWELAKVPQNELQFLYDNGWEFDLTGEDFGGFYGYSENICGLTVYREKTIYIRDDEWSIQRSAIHELGHALDYEFDWASETPEFYKIYDKEKYNFEDCVSIGDGHEIADVNEYWASVYQNMVLNYDDTYADIPETVEYIESYLNLI
jgi:hypothetical protein